MTVFDFADFDAVWNAAKTGRVIKPVLGTEG